MTCSVDTKLAQLSRKAKKFKQHENKDQYEQSLFDLTSFLAHSLPEEPLKILDAGGAYGTFATYAASKGHDVFVVDAMPELHSDKMFEKYGITFAKVNLETDTIPFDGFDRVYFTEVIEHLNYNPVPVVQKLYDALKPGGELICTTPMKELQGTYHPNQGRYSQYVHYRDIPLPWNGYQFFDDHHYFYRKVELAQLFHEVGFDIVECYGIRKSTTHYIRVRKPNAA